jgi:hypothetical protein
MTKAPAQTTESPNKQTPAAAPGGKLGLIIALLRRPEGADLSAMMEATGWQQHSVRGALAGALKRQRGLNITSEKTDKTRIYRIVEQAVEPASATEAKPRRAKSGSAPSAEADHG